MGKLKFLTTTLSLGFSILILNGCGSQATANKVVSALENEDYNQASQIFEEALYNTSDKNELNDTVSAKVQLYLDEAYEEMDGDSFYSLITHIEEIGIYEKGFFSTVDNYKELAGIDVEDDYSYIEDDSYEEYTDEEEYNSNEESFDNEEYYEEEGEEVTTSDNPYTATDIDHDCSDFETGWEAQLFYIANGGPEYDPHDLDRDNDGQACDWNP
ncbi:excalibur calcium-binding domain-containing protein [Neobacillus niacini]|uniref:excalibur calcium-binding domain-containing protein n=1 Tax=Neobacillus niacini TaxID=86668 RepID=UPI0039839FF6